MHKQSLSSVLNYIYTKTQDDNIDVFYHINESEQFGNEAYLTVTYEINELFLGEISFSLNYYSREEDDWIVDVNDIDILKEFTLRIVYKVFKYFSIYNI